MDKKFYKNYKIKEGLKKVFRNLLEPRKAQTFVYKNLLSPGGLRRYLAHNL